MSEDAIDLTGEPVQAVDLKVVVDTDFPPENFDLLRRDSTKTQFYNMAAEYLNTLEGHWWCRRPAIMTEMLYLFQHAQNEVVTSFIEKVDGQLCACKQCIISYQTGKGNLHMRYSVDYELDTVNTFFGILFALDTARLEKTLSFDSQESSSVVRSAWDYGFYEVLCNPKLLGNRGMMETFTRSLLVMLDKEPNRVNAPSAELLGGALLLLVHPHIQISSWALETAGSGYHFQPVAYSADLCELFEQLVRVLEFDLFQDTSTVTTFEDMNTANIYFRYERTSFWDGLYYVVRCIDVHISVNLGENFGAFVSIVADHVGHATLFLPAMRCFKLLCEGLTKSIWSTIQLAPSSMVNVLIQHCRNGVADDSGAVQNAAISIMAPLLISLQSCADYQSYASRLIKFLAVEIRNDGFVAEIQAKGLQIALETVTHGLRHFPALVGQTSDVWITPSLRALTISEDFVFATANFLLKEAIGYHTRMVREVFNSHAPAIGQQDWVTRFFGDLMAMDNIRHSVAAQMLCSISTFSLLDLELLDDTEQASYLASVVHLRIHLAKMLTRFIELDSSGATTDGRWEWETRADCLQAVFPHIVGCDKGVADAMADLLRVRRKESSLMEALQALASNASVANPEIVGSTHRQRLPLKHNFVAGVCSTLSQLVHWRPAKCARSLSKLFLYMKVPEFLAVIVTDADWGPGAISMCWSISAALLAEMDRSHLNDVLAIRFFEFLIVLWPHIVTASKDGSFVDAESHFTPSSNMDGAFTWFRNLVSWGACLKPAVQRRWSSCCESISIQLPTLTNDASTSAIVADCVLSTVADIIKNTQAHMVLQTIRIQLQANFPSVRLYMPATAHKNLIEDVKASKLQDDGIEKIITRAPPSEAARLADFVTINGSRWGARQGRHFLQKKALGNIFRAGKPFVRPKNSRKITSLFPKWQAPADTDSSSASSDSDSENTVGRKKVRKKGRLGTSKKYRNLLEEMGDDEDPILAKARELRAKRAAERKLNPRLTMKEILPAKGKAPSWQNRERTTQQPKLDRRNLYRQILQWDVDNLANEALPPVKNVAERFKDGADYIQQFEPLLLMECHAQIVKATEELERGRTDGVRFKVQKSAVQRVDKHFFLIFQLPLDQREIPREHDLVILATSGGKTGAASKIRVNLFGLVEADATGDDGRTKKELRVKVSIPEHGSRSQIASKAIFNRTTFLITGLCSLATIEREYIALYSIYNLNIRSDLFQSSPTGGSAPGTDIGHEMRLAKLKKSTTNALRKEFNSSQVKAIRSAFEGPKRIVLLQGPPGTGKTKTIIGLITSFLDNEPGNLSPKKRPRALVCAPSNSAVDELTLRLISINRPGSATDPTIVVPVVRVGDPRKMHTLVKSVHIDVLLEKALVGIAKRLPPVPGPAEVDKRKTEQEKQKKLSDQIGQIHEARNLIALAKGSEQYIALTQQLTSLHSKKEKVNVHLNQSFGSERRIRGLHRAARERARLDILNRAEVICCTLSGAGSAVMAENVRGAEMIVVDEAAQATEVASLIPLQHLADNQSRCVLVGDPCQLPATVLSRAAQAVLYHRSLFARLQQCDFPVRMLDTQYRMHPTIARFPSEHFYAGELTNGQNVSERPPEKYTECKIFGPTVVWDIDSTETKAGTSVKNPVEAAVLARLLLALFSQHPTTDFSGKIGVLTPYQAQRSEILGACRLLSQRQRQWVEVNTVDAFQGREKDIIIFSCVRANAGKGIGFLADKRRMNVALTRARHAVWVLGNRKSLCRNRDWASYLAYVDRAGCPFMAAASADDISRQVESCLLLPDPTIAKFTGDCSNSTKRSLAAVNLRHTADTEVVMAGKDARVGAHTAAGPKKRLNIKTSKNCERRPVIGVNSSNNTTSGCLPMHQNMDKSADRLATHASGPSADRLLIYSPAKRAPTVEEVAPAPKRARAAAGRHTERAESGKLAPVSMRRSIPLSV
jgi:hypothetical protein